MVKATLMVRAGITTSLPAMVVMAMDTSAMGMGMAMVRITAKQHNFILSLLKNKGITKSEINQKCVDVYGSVLDYLSRADASSLISELQS